VGNSYAGKKTFTREYTYQASEMDSKVSSRTNATAEMRSILLREVGTFIRSEQQTSTQGDDQDYAEKIEAITAGIVEMKVLDEQWNGSSYYIKAEMTVNPDDVNKRIAEVLNDKQKTKDLEESRQRALAAEAEIAKLKSEMELQRKQLAEGKNADTKVSDESKNKDLHATYQKQVDMLDAEEYLIKGNNAYENKSYDAAIKYYRKAIDINPLYVGAYNNIGVTYYDQKNYAQAINYYQKVVDINPNYANAYNNLGLVYSAQENLTQAIHNYQKAIDIDPNFVMAYNNMGAAYNARKNYAQAINCYKKSIVVDSTSKDAHYNMGVVYFAQKDYLQAINCYQKAIDIDPECKEAYCNMGEAYREQKEYVQAIESYQKAIDIDPNFVLVYGNMAVAYQAQGNQEETIKCLQKAAQLGNTVVQKLLDKAGYEW
jgi:superkiller protein 3